MQSAFRVQNGCLFEESNREFKRKENAYVFDFDPARTLNIFEKFANDLSLSTTSGRGTKTDHEQNVKELLNFFPVYGEDEEGKMIELDASKVLIIPRKIRSTEVVRKGFMSNFLFQNISFVFGAPKAITNILDQLNETKEPKQSREPTSTEIFDGAEELSLDEDGNVEIPEAIIIGKTEDLFGDKIYENHHISEVDEIVSTPIEQTSTNEFSEKMNKLKKGVPDIVETHFIKPMIKEAEEKNGKKLKKSEMNQLSKKLETNTTNEVNQILDTFEQEQKIIDAKEKEDLEACVTEEEKQEVKKVYKELREENTTSMQNSLKTTFDNVAGTSSREITKTFEESKQNEKKKDIEEYVKNHLRGFTRTIPSFLMAYGTPITELKNFDLIIPNDVFKEVTGITLEDFRFLRNGGEYIDEETGEKKNFEGNIFDELVFNDSIKEFMNLKEKLSNYFDESQKEDIFDYIPPQKTNQIFTPKKVVKKMVDLLEEENPDCFSDPNKTFADLYMKSGLYITEIVKRLYNNENMKQLIPDDTERLKHIFAKQVYGLAPTEIIYRISTNYILGFDNFQGNYPNNFKQVDALEYVKNGTLQEKIDELFGDDK